MLEALSVFYVVKPILAAFEICRMAVFISQIIGSDSTP